MGMFDTFSGFNDKCPGCDTIIKDYQTKALACELKDWKLNEAMDLQNLDCNIHISSGWVTGYWLCDKCGKLVFAEVIINNGIVVGSQNLRFNERRNEENDDD